MKKLILLTLTVLCCFSCIGKNQNARVGTTAVAETSVWLFENEMIKQTVEVSQRNDTILRFNYTIYDKTTGISHEMSGIAKHNPEMDVYGVEIDEDDEGAYGIIEYIYDDTCSLAFRLEIKENRRMTIRTSEFADDYNSQGTLIKIE